MLFAKMNSSIIIILQPDNLERMKLGDPIIMEKFLDGKNLMICYEELSLEELHEKLKPENFVKGLEYLTRGFTRLPEDGMHPVLVRDVIKKN